MFDMSCPECRPYGLSSCPMCEEPPQECPTCKGHGVVNCTAWNITLEEEVSVTPETYYCLPVTEAEARAKRQHYIRYAKDNCPTCDGSGLVWKDRSPL